MRAISDTLPARHHKRTSSLTTLPVAPLNISKTSSVGDGVQTEESALRSPKSPHTPKSPQTPPQICKLPPEPQTPVLAASSWSPGNAIDRQPYSIPSLNSPPSLQYQFPLEPGPKMRRRQNALRELYETECQFAQDMAVVVRLYLCSSADVGLSPDLTAALFSNITEILDVSLSFVAILEANVPEQICSGSSLGAEDIHSDIDVQVGHAMCLFLTAPMYHAFEVYAHSNQEQMTICFALRKMGKSVQKWLSECGREAQGLTTAWSLDALLIKPVQRLGKYPLFLDTLMESTDPTHPDYPDIVTAHRRARHYIECINARFGCRSMS